MGLLGVLIIPLLGVFWFLNFIKFLEKLHTNKNTHNQKLLGCVLTFLFIAAFLFGIEGLVNAHR